MKGSGGTTDLVEIVMKMEFLLQTWRTVTRLATMGTNTDLLKRMGLNETSELLLDEILGILISLNDFVQECLPTSGDLSKETR